MIQKAEGGDLFEIETAADYSKICLQNAWLEDLEPQMKWQM